MKVSNDSSQRNKKKFNEEKLFKTSTCSIILKEANTKISENKLNLDVKKMPTKSNHPIYRKTSLKRNCSKSIPCMYLKSAEKSLFYQLLSIYFNFIRIFN